MEVLTGDSQVRIVNRRFEEIGAAFAQAAASPYPGRVEEAAIRIAHALESRRKLLVFGNGGSASDAQHICGELVVRYQSRRRALPAIALCSDAAVLTACGNDYSYEDIFARQIEALGETGDVALGISTSGNSPNVVRAFEVARRLGIFTILLTGPKPGSACDQSDMVLAAPGTNTARIQEFHIASYHAICEIIEERFL